MNSPSPIGRLGATAVLVAAFVAACSGATTTASPSTVAAPPSAELPSASVPAAPSESAAASAPASLGPTVRVITVYAYDGKFTNAPVTPVVGDKVAFRNEGDEAHEMVVIRRNADATEKQTFEDLSKVSPTDLAKFVTVVGVLVAGPHQEATDQITLDQAGDYAIVDLLAKGTTEAPASPDPFAIPTGVPNLASGMFATFSVAEAGG